MRKQEGNGEKKKELCPFLSPPFRHLKFDFLIFATDEVRDPMSNITGTHEFPSSLVGANLLRSSALVLSALCMNTINKKPPFIYTPRRGSLD